MNNYIFKNASGYMRIKAIETDELFTNILKECTTEKDLTYAHDQLEALLHYVYKRELRRIQDGTTR